MTSAAEQQVQAIIENARSVALRRATRSSAFTNRDSEEQEEEAREQREAEAEEAHIRSERAIYQSKAL